MNKTRERMTEIIAEQTKAALEKYGVSKGLNRAVKAAIIKEISMLAASDIFYVLDVKEQEQQEG